MSLRTLFALHVSMWAWIGLFGNMFVWHSSWLWSVAYGGAVLATFMVAWLDPKR